MAVTINLARPALLSVGILTAHAVSLGITGVTVGVGLPYEGAYSVTPQTYSAQTLPTQGRLLSQNVQIARIPQYEVSNPQNGTTLIIGDEFFNV